MLQEVVWREQGATSVAFNADYEDMLCFSGPGGLSICTSDFPLHTQKITGFVVGFKVRTWGAGPGTLHVRVSLICPLYSSALLRGQPACLVCGSLFWLGT